MTAHKESYKKVPLTGQTVKTMMNLYGMKYHSEWDRNIAAIKPKLLKLTKVNRLRNLIPKQVQLIVEHLGEPLQEL